MNKIFNVLFLPKPSPEGGGTVNKKSSGQGPNYGVYIIVAIAAFIVLGGVVNYAMSQPPATTTSQGQQPPVAPPAKNAQQAGQVIGTPTPSPTKGQETTTIDSLVFQEYKKEYGRLRGLSDATITNPYALIPIEDIDKGEFPLAYSIYTSTAATTASVQLIEIKNNKITITVKDGKNPQGQKFKQGVPLKVILLTKDYYVAILPDAIPDKSKPAEYTIQGTAKANTGKSLEELIPEIQYLVIAVNR